MEWNGYYWTGNRTYNTVINGMDVSIVIILLAVGLFVIRELLEKLDFLRSSRRPQTATVDMMALKAGLIERPPNDPMPTRLKNGEDGFENGIEVR